MTSQPYILVFGPVYRDLVIETDTRLVNDDPPLILDQSIAASRVEQTDDGQLMVFGPTGDHLRFILPNEFTDASAIYHLQEPILARLLGQQTRQTVIGDYPVRAFRAQLGGMGAGYAKAFQGILRTPFGAVDGHPDVVGSEVLSELHRYGIQCIPALLPECASDTSTVLLSDAGDKLAIGARNAMVRWQPTIDDFALAERASALIFCGAPNAFVLEVLAKIPRIPTMCAPAMRNVCDTATPLVALASQIDYLTLNALEWAQTADRDRLVRETPVISVTDGARGSRLYLRGEEHCIPAIPFDGAANVNRAGETYGATLFKALLREAPDLFTTRRVDQAVALRAGRVAARQAHRQIGIVGFAFPPDDWM